MTSEYTAASIQILDSAEVQERFVWAKAHELAWTYRKPLAWIERGLHACERAGVPHGYFIDKYLKGLPLPKHDGVNAALLDIIAEQAHG